VSDVYLKINSLIRRLQALAQLERQWYDEVEKIRTGEFDLKDVFFQVGSFKFFVLTKRIFSIKYS